MVVRKIPEQSQLAGFLFPNNPNLSMHIYIRQLQQLHNHWGCVPRPPHPDRTAHRKAWCGSIMTVAANPKMPNISIPVHTGQLNIARLLIRSYQALALEGPCSSCMHLSQQHSCSWTAVSRLHVQCQGCICRVAHGTHNNKYKNSRNTGGIATCHIKPPRT